MGETTCTIRDPDDTRGGVDPLFEGTEKFTAKTKRTSLRDGGN